MQFPNNLPDCHSLLLKQQEKIEELTARLEAMENRAKKDSRNSNKPPSSDGLTKRPAIPKPSGKKQGGQKGHKGNKLQLVHTPEEIDEVVVLPVPATCTDCGHKLDQEKAQLQEIRQEFDLPEPKLHITEYQRMVAPCSCCGSVQSGTFPAHINASTQYGSGVKSLTVLLHTGFSLPVGKVKQLFEDLFGYPINGSTIQNNTAYCHEKLAPVEAAIKKSLRDSSLGHSDETGLRVAGKLHWVHVFSNALYTFFFVHQKRGKEALDSPASLLKSYAGWVVHDCWSSYFKVSGIKHALCGAHILRELYALEEQGVNWARWFVRLLLTLHHLVEKGEGVLSAEEQKKAQALYEKICAAVDKIEPPPERKKGKRGRPKSTPGRNLLHRLISHQDAVLAFAFHQEVPFTNNQAERDLRPLKTKQKVAGCFRTLIGAERHVRIFGFISTVRKQQQNTFSQLKAVFEGRKIKVAL